jgi:hypothetical protein
MMNVATRLRCRNVVTIHRLHLLLGTLGAWVHDPSSSLLPRRESSSPVQLWHITRSVICPNATLRFRPQHLRLATEGRMRVVFLPLTVCFEGKLDMTRFRKDGAVKLDSNTPGPGLHLPFRARKRSRCRWIGYPDCGFVWLSSSRGLWWCIIVPPPPKIRLFLICTSRIRTAVATALLRLGNCHRLLCKAAGNGRYWVYRRFLLLSRTMSQWACTFGQDRHPHPV